MPAQTAVKRKLDPGEAVYYTLDDLKEGAEDFNWADWGVCRYEGRFWAGDRILIEGKEVLLLSLIDILERRDEQYPEWGDEEVFLLVGLDHESKEFIWALANKEEFKKQQEEYEKNHEDD